MDQQIPFPSTLETVPPEARLTETFAFIPGALAIGALLSLVGILIRVASDGGLRSIEDLYIPAGCVAGAALFGMWEIWRRMRKTTLAFRGDHIGVYRQGKLEGVIYRSQITIYELNIFNTIREFVVFGIFGFGGLFSILAAIGSEPAQCLMLLGIGVVCIGAFISSMYARMACRHLFIPKGGGTEQVMFTRGAIGRFGI
jgi:hypothetical protein